MRKSKKSKTLELMVVNIVEEELQKAKINYDSIKAIVYPFKTVGVQGDEGTYAHPVELDITSKNKKRIYEECVEKISNRITNEIKGINRVLYTLKFK